MRCSTNIRLAENYAIFSFLNRACPILLEPFLNKGFNRFYSRQVQDYGK
jgi:hypothetical protein